MLTCMTYDIKSMIISTLKQQELVFIYSFSWSVCPVIRLLLSVRHFMYLFVFASVPVCFCLSVCLPDCLSVLLYVSLSVCLSVGSCLSVSRVVCLSVCLFICFCLCVCLSVCSSICWSVCLSVFCLYVYLSVWLYVHLSVCLSICLCLGAGLLSVSGAVSNWRRRSSYCHWWPSVSDHVELFVDTSVGSCCHPAVVLWQN